MDDLSVLSDWRMWAVLVGVGGAIVFYCWEKFALELVSVVILCSALVFFELFGADDAPTAAALLAGFSNPALLTIMALLVVGQGIFHTGALDGPTRTLLSMFDVRPKLTIVTLFALVFGVSAFINNTPVVVMFIPILGAVAARMGGSASVFMMPLSFVCIFAGMTTLIGSSTNLLVADSLLASTGETLGFFQPAQMGVMLSIVGMIYIAFIMPKLLPEREESEDDKAGSPGKQYIAQIEVTAGHPLVGAKPVAGMFTELGDITVRMVQRNEDAFLPPFDSIVLKQGDLIIIAATRKKLTELLSSRAEFVEGVLRSAGPADLPTRGERLALTEAVVSPGSRLIGRTVRQIGFRHAVGAIVLGVQRRSRMIRAKLGEIRLEAGDVLLLFGGADAMRRLRADRDVLLMDWATSDLPDIRKASIARAILGGVVLAASTGLLPIVVASLIGAAAMIGAGCLNVRQAARAFDLKLYLLIGSAFALGTAMEATGGATVLAMGVVHVFSPLGTTALVSALFFLVMVLTNVLSNNATAILFTPIAVTAANSVGADPTLFALTVLFAANTCFATPIGYQTNLLVMGPGKYRFADFIRAGAPLAVLIWLAFTVLVGISFALA
ncbi:SLC13 family permease [Oceanicaulis sp.]|uniref:SLC13 family permease n=1 Tax=Oceanicaulis sp. TaxID=1924941 RepID=UPI003BAC4B78